MPTMPTRRDPGVDELRRRIWQETDLKTRQQLFDQIQVRLERSLAEDISRAEKNFSVRDAARSKRQRQGKVGDVGRIGEPEQATGDKKKKSSSSLFGLRLWRKRT